MYAADAMTLSELKSRLTGLDAEKRLAEEELAAINDAESRLEEMERRKRALLSAYSTGLKLGVFWFPPELRRLVYELMGLRAVVHPDGAVEVRLDLDADLFARLTPELERYAKALQEADRRLQQYAREDPPRDPSEDLERVERELARIRDSFGDPAQTGPTS
jgi:hypothetical protein